NNNSRFTIKWSKNNASVAFPIKQLIDGKLVVLEPGGRSLVGVFRVGDLIEIIDDKDELSEHPKGQMRRISHIDMDNRILSWSSEFNSNQTETIRDLHEPIKIEPGRYQPDLHAKVILWDGIKYGNSEEEAVAGESQEEEKEEENSPNHLITLDGTIGVNGPIRIKFDPGVFRSGDYWTFTTRSNGSIELLTSAKPMGPKHDYAPLALIKKEPGKEIEIVEDLRHTFQPLSDLRAIDIPYEEGGRMSPSSMTIQAAIQRLSAGRVQFLPGHRNKKTIKDVLIEAGEIYQLKRAKGEKENFTSTVSFNDVYEHQPFLIYTITSGNRVDVRHEIHWLAADEEGNIIKDPIDDGTKNYAWKGFRIKADKNAQISWLAVGDSYTYFERYVKRTLDEVFKVLFGVDTDQLKEDSSILDAWHKNLEKWTGSGPGLSGQAREQLQTLQHDWDRFVRKVDKQVEDFERDVDEFFGVEDEENENKNQLEEEEESREPVRPFGQTVSCPNCGESFRKGVYAFCTKCGTSLPVE
ncbi:MAG: zinc ribbon domain-containing protein, partial [Thermoproteota archaeon]|nr:zinc ribbon domain-containing protein [Thermoproteota archaeon]